MMSKLSFIIGILLFSGSALTQSVFPMLDNQGYFKSYHEGTTTQLDYLTPKDVKFSENIIAYIDNKSDLFVFDGVEKEKLTGFTNSYQVGIDLVAWNAGPIVNVWDNGEKQTLTQFGNRYIVSDSLVVFDDTRDKAIKVYYKGEVYELYSAVTSPRFPTFIGSNSVAFRGNGGVYYTFIAGKINEIGVLTDANPVKFAAGGNLIAFNDPFNQSFAVGFKNEIVDVEDIRVQNYQAGYDMFAYQDQNDNLKAYIDDELVTLSSYPSFYKVYRDMVVWGENGVFYTFRDGKRYEIANYIPEEYEIRDGIVAFRNLNGGVSVFHHNEVEVISNLVDVPFEVNGNTVKVQVNRGNYIFFKNGFSQQI